MTTITWNTVESYLGRTWHPDREYIDGRIEERNLGEYDHARLQGALVVWFANHQRDWRIRVLPEQRIRVSETRYRIPDVTVLKRSQPIEPVFTHPPLLVIEVLSPEDTLSGYQDRIWDYLKFGVEHIWILDPVKKRAWTAAPGMLIQAEVLEIPRSPIHLPVPGIFEEEEE
jgi:Uma2 family endonuclease